MASRYNSERYYSPTEYEAFTRIEKEERAAAKAAAFRPIVYICSPYSHGCINTNIENARKYSRFAVDRHCMPITPHIYFTYFFRQHPAMTRILIKSLRQRFIRRCRSLTEMHLMPHIFSLAVRTMCSGLKAVFPLRTGLH